ncbi:MAG: hypothetical protein M0Z27_03410 [Thermaerobacter sp.]|nr:hypothetical protein [Thermaerobacter sp.]
MAAGSTVPATYSADLPPGFELPPVTLFPSEHRSAADLASGVLTVAGGYLAAQAVRPSPRGRAPEELREDG